MAAGLAAVMADVETARTMADEPGWFGGVDARTRERFALLPAEEREVIAAAPVSPAKLSTIVGDDPASATERRAFLSGRRARLDGAPPPETTGDLLASLATSRDPALPLRCAEALARDFADPQSWRKFEKDCKAVWRRQEPVERLLHAYGKAMGPACKNRGAIFVIEWKRWEPARV